MLSLQSFLREGRVIGPCWKKLKPKGPKGGGAEERSQGPLWGYLKVNSSETLSIFGDKYPQNGSKNDLMAPRMTLECPHEGPSVGAARGR